MHSEANVNGHKPSLDVGRTECLESNESSSESLPISQRSQQWLRWYEGLENAEEVSVGDLPDEVQRRLKAVVREIRKLDEVANQG
ncbi:MAG: hypothetical protein QGG09_06865 [Pirellulaceae bacterium]|nr:hypothetical protein [Pirellulaceae bacterium]HJN11255.1 hypothetical protein [Pirellulaceae bacterium]